MLPKYVIPVVMHLLQSRTHGLKPTNTKILVQLANILGKTELNSSLAVLNENLRRSVEGFIGGIT